MKKNGKKKEITGKTYNEEYQMETYTAFQKFGNSLT